MLVTLGARHVLEIQIKVEDNLLRVYKVSVALTTFLHHLLVKAEMLTVTITAVQVAVSKAMALMVEPTVVTLEVAADMVLD